MPLAAKPPPELLEFLWRYEPAVKELALGLRQLVHEEMMPCHEYIFAMRSKVVLLYGATERVVDDGICHINVFARHVNLGFSRGTELEDSGGILRGSGVLPHLRQLVLGLLVERRDAGVEGGLHESTPDSLKL